MIRDKIKKIALIYEGIKTEKNLFRNIAGHFFDGKADLEIVTLPADGNLYMLWERMKADDFETDVLSVLREMSREASEQLKDYDRNDFSEVYLFFDYDGHNNNVPKSLQGQDALQEMLATFDNERELGKLYISYPMIESINEISIERRDYVRLYFPLSECGEYKENVGGKSDYGDYRKISKRMWHIACDASRKRASLIVTYKNECTYDEFLKNMTQRKIYEAQKSHYIKNNKMIGILNSVPLFLIEYYEEEFWKQICDKEKMGAEQNLMSGGAV